MIVKNLETLRGDSISFRLVLKKNNAPYDMEGVEIVAEVTTPGGGRIVSEFEVLEEEQPSAYIFHLSGKETQSLRGNYDWYVRLVSPAKTITIIGGKLRSKWI